MPWSPSGRRDIFAFKKFKKKCTLLLIFSVNLMAIPGILQRREHALKNATCCDNCVPTE